MIFQRPKGTKDWYGQDINLFNSILDCLCQTAIDYGLQPIMTPVIEMQELFLRAVGDESEIAQKEIYQIIDKKGRKLALRPEGTAGVVRAIIENKLLDQPQISNLKYFYYGPMYRYERPQKGRSREFFQFGVENFNPATPYIDAEIIMLAATMLEKLPIKDFKLEINFFGSAKTKKVISNYLAQEFLSAIDSLCSDCQSRVKKNPFRVLDCKIDQKQKWNFNFSQFYQFEENLYFEQLQNILQKLHIPFVINQQLVRGLDYYTGVIFEFTVKSEELGVSQKTIIGGGRYDQLCEQLGAKKTVAAIGFAFGIERIMLLLQTKRQTQLKQKGSFEIISLNQECMMNVLILSHELQQNGFITNTWYQLFSQKQAINLLKKTSSHYLLIWQNISQLQVNNLLTREKTVLDATNFNLLVQNLFALLEKNTERIC